MYFILFPCRRDKLPIKLRDIWLVSRSPGKVECIWAKVRQPETGSKDILKSVRTERDQRFFYSVTKIYFSQSEDEEQLRAFNYGSLLTKIREVISSFEDTESNKIEHPSLLNTFVYIVSLLKTSQLHTCLL